MGEVCGEDEQENRGLPSETKKKESLLGEKIVVYPTNREKRRNRWVEALEETQRNKGKGEIVGRKCWKKPNEIKEKEKSLGGNVVGHPTK
ncbi:MAG: hypothetical protein IJZ55_04560 [Lachnospiraceae bacterium]|nr:hypothetical protein [Lachnospiraceae bacterium]